MENELSTFDMIFGFDGTPRPTPPRLEIPAPQASLDPLEAFKERAEFVGAGIALGLTAERAESDYVNAHVEVKAPVLQFSKRAPGAKTRIVKTESGATIVYDEKDEIVGIYAKGVPVPEEISQ